MTRGLIFWVLMLLWGLSILGAVFGSADIQQWSLRGSSALLFILLALLGWNVYGPAIKGCLLAALLLHGSQVSAQDPTTITVSGEYHVTTLTVPEGHVLRLESGAKVIFDDVPLDLPNDPEQMGNGIIVDGGILELAGATKTPAARATGSLAKGATAATVIQPPQGWLVGDELGVMDTQQRIFQKTMNFASQSEVVTITAIEGNVIHFAPPLKFDHLVGPRESRTPHFANLTRDFTVESANPAGTRGHIIAINGGSIVGKGGEFRHLGRTTAKRPLDSTLRDAHGILIPLNGNPHGTNQIGRYPLHGHNPMGMGDNVTINLEGTVVRDYLKIGISLHGTKDSVLRHVVCWNGEGAGIFGEDGTETGLVSNCFCGKLIGGYSQPRGGVVAIKDRAGAKLIDTAMNGAGYWLRGGGLAFEECVAADCRGIGFNWDGYYATMLPALAAPIKNLESYCSMNAYYSVLSQGTALDKYAPIVMDDIVGWSTWEFGLLAYHTGPHVLNRPVLENFEAVSSKNSGAFNSLTRLNQGLALISGSYENPDHVINEPDIQGWNIGLAIPQNVMLHGKDTEGTFTVNGGKIVNNYVNVLLPETMREGNRVPPNRFASLVNVDVWSNGTSTKPLAANWLPSAPSFIWAFSNATGPTSRQHLMVTENGKTFAVFHKDDPNLKCQGVRLGIEGLVCEDAK